MAPTRSMDCALPRIPWSRPRNRASGAEETKDVVLGVSQHTNIDFSLQVGEVQSSVTVVEARPTLDTGSAEIGTTISGEYTREMPLYGRSYFGLVFLSGGVTEAAGNGIRDNYPTGHQLHLERPAQRHRRSALRRRSHQRAGARRRRKFERLLHAVGGSDPGIQGRKQQLLCGVRQQRRHRSEHHDEAGRQPDSTAAAGGSASATPWTPTTFSAIRPASRSRRIPTTNMAAPSPAPSRGTRRSSFSIMSGRTTSALGRPWPPCRRTCSAAGIFRRPTRTTKTAILRRSPSTIRTRSMPTATARLSPTIRFRSACWMRVAKKLLAYFPRTERAGRRGHQLQQLIAEMSSPATPAISSTSACDHNFNDNNHLGVRYSRGHYINPVGETFVDDSYLYKTDVHNAVVDYNWTISPTLLYTGRIGLDLAIAPGITKYPDLTSVGFPSILEANGLTRMPMIEFDQTYSQPVRPVLRGHALQPHLIHLLVGAGLGERLALHQIRRRAATVLQQLLAAGQSHRSVQLRSGRDQSAAGQRRRDPGRSFRQFPARLWGQHQRSAEYQAARRQQIQGDRLSIFRTTGK